MTKFKEYFERMIATNKQIFDEFRILHNKYQDHQELLQEEFNKKGEIVMRIIKDWENKLCLQSEKAGYSGYTSNLSEKFMYEVRAEFPMIDYVGVITKSKPSFTLKRISL
jgi:hypothetical protein